MHVQSHYQHEACRQEILENSYGYVISSINKPLEEDKQTKQRAQNPITNNVLCVIFLRI